MPSVCRSFLLAAGLLALAVAAPAAHAQEKKKLGDKVRIPTVDGVDLHGTFIASDKPNAPTVLILHALGEDSKKKNYQELAAALQPKFAVMLFDFRGHGDSTNLQPDLFWKQNANKSLVKGYPKSDTIAYKDYSKNSGYLPYLVNDIAAVKAFLDRKNDQGACNTASFVVMGAETGATLGAIWLNSEYHRYKLTPSQMFGPPQPANTPEGKDTVAVVWASIAPKLGSLSVNLSAVHDLPAKQGGTSVVLMYAQDSAADKAVAKNLEKAIKGTKDAKEGKYKYTLTIPVPQVKLGGQNLFSRSNDPKGELPKLIEEVASEKGNDWSEREFTKTMYAWRNLNLPVLNPQAFRVAKPTNEKNFNFDSYSAYSGGR